jgi:hypothetical protein
LLSRKFPVLGVLEEEEEGVLPPGLLSPGEETSGPPCGVEGSLAAARAEATDRGSSIETAGISEILTGTTAGLFFGRRMA